MYSDVRVLYKEGKDRPEIPGFPLIPVRDGSSVGRENRDSLT